ncbi:TonB-dependent receptor [Pseudomaricurvus alkylphenolicus]|uniref:TonB-dependent receptor n=1 Tax=Pseudomaricurvus alkylphenolicus TaxID=1306991 RepID=UPI0014213053|nr:TonB-dependent receptor [Pseudomaricurvus alkylphenolicus]NIB40772.1 TonB-dependent receptor [Pseudomaricurvus alkylphenolicus]
MNIRANKLYEHIRIVTLGGVLLPLGGYLIPLNAQAQGELDGKSEAEMMAELEEIQVTGIRGSLQNAASIKEDAAGVMDAITSEDLGKFPDTNIAESLQRVPGLAIARSRGGEGRFVTIRGLGEEFNAVTYNGRLLATENPGREFSFDNVASELVSRADVYKTSQASLGDGSIGGLVDIITARPLDKPEFHGAWSLGGSYDDLIEDEGERFSGVISNSFLDDTVGVIASVAFQRRDFRVDSVESIDTFTMDVATDGTRFGSQPGQTLAHENARWTSLAFSSTEEERERISGTLALQFQPNDQIDMVVDMLYTQLESPGFGVVQTNYTCDPGCASLSNIEVAENGVITAFDADYTAEFLAREQSADSETFQIGWNLDWQVNDSLNLQADLSYSKAEAKRDNIGSDSGSGSFYVVGIPASRAEYRYRGGEVPNWNVFVPNYDPVIASGVGPAVVPIANADPRLLGAHFTRESNNTVEDEVLTFHFDGEWVFDNETSIQFGGDYTDRNKKNELRDNRDNWCNYFCGYGFSVRGLNPQLFDSAFVQSIPVSNLLDGSSQQLPRDFLAFSTDALRDIYASVNQGDPVLDAEGNPTGAIHDFTGNPALSDGSEILAPVLNLTGSTDITEKVLGVYGQLNLSGDLGDMHWTGNIGLRIAHTKLESRGHSNEITSITDAGAGNQVFTFSSDTPRNIDNSYTDVLPSLNLTLELDDGLLLRTAFSKTITRPTLTDLSTARDVTGTNVGTEAITAGNPELEPTRANNVDLSLEWYGENNNAAVALFYKDIKGFVANQVGPEFVFDRTFEVTKPVNGENAEVTGVELAYTHYFENGFGFQANYTFVDSDAEQEGQTSTLENVSESSYNLSGFYENDNFSARLSFNNRGDYIRTTNGKQGLAERVDDYNQLDFTTSYTFNDFLTVYFEGVNLLDETEFVHFDAASNLIRYYEERGRRFNLGLRGSF